MDQVHAAQEHCVVRDAAPIEPRLHLLRGDTKIARELVFAAEDQAGAVQRLDVDVSVLGGRRADVRMDYFLLSAPGESRPAQEELRADHRHRDLVALVEELPAPLDDAPEAHSDRS